MSETSSVRGRRRAESEAAAAAEDAMDEEAGEALLGGGVRPQMRCNACWAPILPDATAAETCYRTGCSHLFCVRSGWQWLWRCRADAVCRRNARTSTLAAAG